MYLIEAMSGDRVLYFQTITADLSKPELSGLGDRSNAQQFATAKEAETMIKARKRAYREDGQKLRQTFRVVPA